MCKLFPSEINLVRNILHTRLISCGTLTDTDQIQKQKRSVSRSPKQNNCFSYPDKRFDDDRDEDVDEDERYDEREEEQNRRSEHTISRPERLEVHLVCESKT